MAKPTETRSARPLALLLVAALVPLLILAVVTTVVSLRAERAAQERDAQAQARRISTLVDDELQRQLSLVQALTLVPALDAPADLEVFAETLRREEAERPLWLTAMLADPNGNVLIATKVARTHVVDPADFRKVVDSKVPMVGSIRRGTAGLALPIRAPVIRDGEVRYVLIAAIRPDAVRDRLLAGEVPPDWTATVVDDSGRLVARSRGDSAFLGEQASAVALEARAKARSGIYRGVLREGIPAVGVFYVSPVTGWTVYVLIPQASFDAPIRRATWLAIGGSGAAMALAGLFLTLLLRELRLRRTEAAALESAQRMEALGRLTGGVAHDFNNLLAVISGNVDLLERRLPGAAGNRSLLAIRGAVERGVSLTRGLLTFSRSGFGQGTQEQVNVCVHGVFGMMRQTLGPTIEASLDLQEDLPEVVLDRVQFDLAMLNLAANARDAMPQGGKLRITSRPALLPGGKAGVAVAVTDTGSGIAPDVLPRVFEPFFTTKAVGSGTGLGLAQVYGFARNTGGEAQIASRLGEGTTVSMVLPAATLPARMPVAIDRAPPPVQRRDCRILLVEDNEPVREMTAANLCEHFAEVVEAVDAEQALSLLARQEFGAVVSDIMMPGRLDGIGLARAIQQRWPGMPVVLVSGYSASAGEARELGITVLSKPLDPQRLADAVRLEMDRATELHPG